ncbi:MAG TPA: hypothetical protein V6C52_09850 [Coleofasciculaceae cyanobacterium]|jgi:hypothetical protein
MHALHFGIHHPQTSVNAPSKAHAPNPAMYFGKTEDQVELKDGPEATAPKKNIANGFKMALKAVFSKNGLLDDAILIGLFSALLFFIPGHQIFSVPIVLGAGAVFRAISGFSLGINNQSYPEYSFYKGLYRKIFGKNQAE